MRVKISTTSLVDMYLSYRMPKDIADTKNTINPVLNIYLPARGLWVECDFPSEAHFEEFKKQNAFYIDSFVVLIGDKVTANEVEQRATENNTKETKKAKSKVDKGVEKVKEMAKDSKINLEIDTIKE